MKAMGHIVLLIKGWYDIKDNPSIFVALRRVWAIRCGYNYNPTDFDADRYIANSLWRIIIKCAPERLTLHIDNFHADIVNNSMDKPKDMTHIEAIIWEYASIISSMQIKQLVKTNYRQLIVLPKPKKKVFNRIIAGNGRFNDYKLIGNNK